MSTLTEVNALVTSCSAYVGNAPTGAVVPYVVSRPLELDNSDISLAGNTLVWDHQISLYCCGASVEASYNLGILVIKDLDGTIFGGTTLSASMGYFGARVEGHYESQVTVRLNQGELK